MGIMEKKTKEKMKAFLPNFGSDWLNIQLIKNIFVWK